jgi:hypothetical protein
MRVIVLVVALAGIGSFFTARPVDAADKNKCGCYKNAQGTCFCDKKAKCGCPGDCEPKGCEAARDKALQREIEAETRKAAEAGRKHAAVKTSDGDRAPAEKSSKERADDGKSSSGGGGSGGGKKLTPAQTKQLVKLLDLYFQENPDARARNVEDVRNQLSQAR